MAIVSVGESSTEVLAASSVKRNMIILSNRGANTVWFVFGETAVNNTGFPLDAGDKIILTQENSNLNKVLNAIADTSATNISEYEL